MVEIWWGSATYGHGFLILPISAYLAVQRRREVAAAPIHTEPRGCIVLLGAGLVWLIGHLAAVNLLQHFALVGMLQATVLIAFGWPTTRTLAFPLFYLLLAVPFGDFAVAPLQDLTAVYTVELLRLTDIPVFLEDWRIVIPGGTFFVAEACSGIRYILACLALGVLISDLMFRRWWKRGVFIVVSVAVPVVANVFRAYGIVLLAHLSDFKVAVGADHLVYGGVFLTFVTMIIIMLAMWMRDEDRSASQPAAVHVSHAHGEARLSQADRLRQATTMGIAVALIVGVRSYGSWASMPVGDNPVHIAAPERVGAWRRTPTENLSWRATFPTADATQRWTYVRDAMRVDLFTAVYRYEREGAELISAKNSFSGSDSNVIGSGRGPSIADGSIPAPGRIVLAGKGARSDRLIWYWYDVGGVLTARANMAKLYALKAKLVGGPLHASAIAVTTPLHDDAAGRLANFVSDLHLKGLIRLRRPPSAAQ